LTLRYGASRYPERIPTMKEATMVTLTAEPDYDREAHLRELTDGLAELTDVDVADAAIDAIAEAVAECVLAADGPAMEAALASVRTGAGELDRDDEPGGSDSTGWAEQRGRLYGLGDMLRWILRSRSAAAAATTLEPGTHAHRMLSLLHPDGGGDSERLNSGEIARRLGVDKTQVSRTGRELIDRGLAVTTSLGRKTYWDLTPRGRYALEQLGSARVDGRAADALPVAVLVGGRDSRRAAEAAAGAAGADDDLTAYVVSDEALRAIPGRRSSQAHRSIILLDAPGRKRARLDAIARHHVAAPQAQELEVAVNGNVYTVCGPRRGDTPTPGRGRRTPVTTT